MAVEDKYIDSNKVDNKLSVAHAVGAESVTLVKTFEVAAADDDGSTYRIATISGDWIPVRITVMCDTITGGTDYDLGLYTAGVGGAAKDADVYMDGQTLAVASKVLDGLQTLDIANREKKVYESAGDTTATRFSEYDLVLTGNTVGTAAGTVTILAEFVK
jgi:hypothetical protein